MDISLKYYKTSWLITSILISAILIDLIFQGISILMPENNEGIMIIRSPSNAAIIGGLLFLHSKYWWKTKFGKFLIKCPDVSGRYEGTIKFINPITKKHEEKNCAIEVIQNASMVKINSYFQKEDGSERTPSNSLVETIVENPDGSYSLVFTYQNHGNQIGFSPHSGTNILKFICNDEGKSLKGYYYTNREPHQTKGEVDVKFISNNIKNDY